MRRTFQPRTGRNRAPRRQGDRGSGAGLIDAVPDEQVTVRKVSEGSNGTVVEEWTFSGTHQNGDDAWPATGEKVELTGASVCNVDGDLIVEERVYWDTATLLAGAGVLG